MKTLIFQHTAEEAPGSLVDWLEDRKFAYHIHHTYKGLPFPSPEEFQWLVVLGGPMNVDEEDKHPWLKEEKKYVREWLSNRKALLGICLGGQMLAQALGGQVTKNKQREIGFHAVTKAAEEHPAFRRWPVNFPVFQWHEDRFTLPQGCVSLLTSPACEHQAFAKDHRTIGLQFHPESVEKWILENYQDFEPRNGEEFVQSKSQCLRLLPVHLPAMTKKFYEMLDDFIANAGV